MTLINDSTISKDLLLEDFWGVMHQYIEVNSKNELFVSNNGTLTTGNANQQANVIYKILSSPDLAGEAGVAFAFENQMKVIPSLLGSLKAKKYVLCLNFSNPRSRLQFQLNDTNIKLILTETSELSRIKALVSEETKIVNIDDLDLNQDLPNPIVQIEPDDIVQIIYTSGSTGNPKGTIEDYRYLIRSLFNRIKENSSSDRLSMLKGFSFPGPHLGILGALLTGATFCYYDLQKEGVVSFTNWIQQSKITHISITPTLVRNYLQTLEPIQQFPNVHTIKLGAEKKLKYDVELLRKYFDINCKFHVGFASTECGSVCSSTFLLSHEFESDVLPAGKPMEDIEILIWNEQFEEVPFGQEGEIVIRGNSLAQGYWNLPELTKEKFIPDPSQANMQLYRSGDLGKMLPDGQLMHLGRIDHMVKIKGIRIELESIENHTLSYPGITQVASKSFDDKRGIQRLATYFIAEEGITIPLSDLRMHLSERISSQMLPHFLIRIEVFPYTPSGKINTLKLPLPEMVRPELPYPYLKPSNELEKTLVKIWEDQLGIEGIGVTDNFFDVGGDSLIATLLIMDIEKVLGRDLPVTTFIKAPNIRHQALLLSKEKNQADFEPLIPIRENGDTPPLFFVPGYGGHPTRIIDLAKIINPSTPIFAFQNIKEEEWISNKNTIKDKSTFYIDLIKKDFPTGPYFLLGESIGGRYIFEMGQQLMKLGDEVPILAMLDSSNIKKTTPNSQKEKAFIPYIWMLFNKHLTILAKSDWDGRKDYFRYYRSEFFKRLRSTIKLILNGKDNKHIQPSKKNPDPNYIAENYPGKVILFKALRGKNSDKPANGWDNLELGELNIHTVDCYHGGVLFEPAVSVVGEVLNKYILETEK